MNALIVIFLCLPIVMVILLTIAIIFRPKTDQERKLEDEEQLESLHQYADKKQRKN